MDKIKSNLSGLAKAFYEREFDFFSKITAISGTIKYVILLMLDVIIL